MSFFDSHIAWGVDGFGNKHFVCDRCGERLGIHEAWELPDIEKAHKCKPKERRTNDEGLRKNNEENR